MTDIPIETAFGAMARFRRIEALHRAGVLSSPDIDRTAESSETKALEAALATDEGREAIVAAILAYVPPPLAPGTVYEYDASTPNLIGRYTSWERVVVTWYDGVDVHYRKDGSQRVERTPVHRFFEIVRPAAPVAA